MSVLKSSLWKSWLFFITGSFLILDSFELFIVELVKDLKLNLGNFRRAKIFCIKKNIAENIRKYAKFYTGGNTRYDGKTSDNSKQDKSKGSNGGDESDKGSRKTRRSSLKKPKGPDFPKYPADDNMLGMVTSRELLGMDSKLPTCSKFITFGDHPGPYKKMEGECSIVADI